MLGLNASVPATCFPTASISACSWDEDLLSGIGGAIAQEAGANGVCVVLGPGVNIKRNPLCGRNFEYFSEDPVPVRGMEKLYTLSTSLSDAMEGSAILRLVYRIYEKKIAKQSGRGTENDTDCSDHRWS